MFKPVKSPEFNAALRDSRASAKFRETFARLMNFDEWIDEDAVAHVGDIKQSTSFQSTAYCTLIIGDMDIDGTIDLATDGGFGEGGVFIVIGNVTCQNFIGDYGKCCLIDGNLVARDSILNAYEDSGLWVIGSLRTRLFIGQDIWAEVGGEAIMEFGFGYCLPLAYDDASEQLVRPLHGESETALIVTPDSENEDFQYGADHLASLIRSGRPIFR